MPKPCVLVECTRCQLPSNIYTTQQHLKLLQLLQIILDHLSMWSALVPSLMQLYWTEWSAVTCLTVTRITPVPMFWFRSIPLACGRESGSETAFPQCLLINQPMCSPWVVPLVLCGAPSLVWWCHSCSLKKCVECHQLIVIFSSMCTYWLFVEADYVMGALPVHHQVCIWVGVKLSVNSELVSWVCRLTSSLLSLRLPSKHIPATGIHVDWWDHWLDCMLQHFVNILLISGTSSHTHPHTHLTVPPQ